jgi:HEPN domain-containing protein
MKGGFDKEWVEKTERANAPYAAEQAFEKFIKCLIRDLVNRDPGYETFSELRRAFEKIHKYDLNAFELFSSAMEKLNKNAFEDRYAHDRIDFNNYIEDIMGDALILFTASASSDGFARARKSKAQSNLINSIEQFNKYREDQRREFYRPTGTKLKDRTDG